MKKLLLLGGAPHQVIAIETARRLGLYTILCDYLRDNPGQYVADKYYPISTTDKDAVLELAKEERVDGVLAYASDPAAPTAAYVAEKLGLPGNSIDAVETLCNKEKFRGFLSQNGFHAPKAKGYTQENKALKELRTFELPVLVKPVDSSGSKGVTVLRDYADAEQAIRLALSFLKANRIIIEEWVEKKHPYQIGGDIFVSNGEIVLWGLMNCHRDLRVNPLVPVGKSWPLQIDDNDAEAVKNTLRAMVDKLGLRSGSVNVELIVDKNNRVYLIDVGPRAGGNRIPEFMRMIFGDDIVEANVKAAMGEPLLFAENRLPDDKCFATHNLHSSRTGLYQGIHFSRELEKKIVKKYLYKKEGDLVTYFDDASKSLGVIFMEFDNYSEMKDMLNKITQHIAIELSPVTRGRLSENPDSLVPRA